MAIYSNEGGTIKDLTSKIDCGNSFNIEGIDYLGCWNGANITLINADTFSSGAKAWKIDLPYTLGTYKFFEFICSGRYGILSNFIIDVENLYNCENPGSAVYYTNVTTEIPAVDSGRGLYGIYVPLVSDNASTTNFPIDQFSRKCNKSLIIGMVHASVQSAFINGGSYGLYSTIRIFGIR